MQDLSFYVLDLMQNSISAHAACVVLTLSLMSDHYLEITISDDGCGMDETQLTCAQDPFYTTRTTRKIGLGIPLFAWLCRQTGGHFSMRSKQGVGTTVNGTLGLYHIDCPPLGEIGASIAAVLMSREPIHVIYRIHDKSHEFCFDTQRLQRQIGISDFKDAAVNEWIRTYIEENTNLIRGGAVENEKRC